MGKYEDLVQPRFEDIKLWARCGASRERIAHTLGVGYSTFRLYVKRHKALALALKLGESRRYPKDWMCGMVSRMKESGCFGEFLS